MNPGGHIPAQLAALQDEAYRDFQCRLMPTVPPQKVLGVRIPDLRRLAKELRDTPQAADFLQVLPHRYYDENNLHGLLISQLRDYDQTVAELERFLPWVDNWATCDLLSPKAFASHPPQLPGQVRIWLASEHTYTVRFALGVIMQHYLKEAYQPEYLQWAAGLHSQEYYVNMMIAWLFATALSVRYDEVLPWLTQRKLPQWVHNKTIQKAIESRRISAQQKDQLRALRWKD